MNVNLTPELERLVRRKVESGLYINQSEEVREAVRLLVEQDRVRAQHLADLKGALGAGVAEADRGELVDGKEVTTEMRAWLQERRPKRTPRPSGSSRPMVK